MLEVEVKAVCDDLSASRKQVERAGAKLTFEGRLVDRRYDIESRELADRDEVLRVRRYETGGSAKTYLDWKGRTETRGAYKIREEVSTVVDDFAAIEALGMARGEFTSERLANFVSRFERRTGVKAAVCEKEL